MNKGITAIQYNSLNLPQSIAIDNAVTRTKGSVTYLYSSAGVKLRTVHSAANNVPTKTTNYADNKIYENGELIRILVDGGYFDVKQQKYYFYVQDHLGSNRVVADQGGQIVQKTHYYPFGSAFAESTSEKAQSYKYNGKELDKVYGLNLYDYSARHYNASLGRFTTVDPLAEKYPSISPYAYVANNPLKYVDYRGDSISLSGLQLLDRALNTNYTGKLKSDLESQTGLTYTVGSDGQMSYSKDIIGNPVIAITTDANGKVIRRGSTTARNLMMSAIDNSRTVAVGAGRRSQTDGPGNIIGLSFRQIEEFMQGTYGLDNTTMGWGMTFMHELSHTAVGGGLSDAHGWGNIGAVETRMNTIRAELNAQGGNFGQRLNYEAVRLTPNGSAYVPFNLDVVEIMESGIIPVPVPGMQFIKITK